MDKSKASEDTKAVEEQKEPTPAAANQKDAMAKQLDDYKESLQRLQAEFENYKKRVEKEKIQFRQSAAAEVVKSFLPVLDSFELALKSVNSGSAPAAAGAEKISSLGPYPAPLVRKLFPTKDQQPNFIPHSSAVVGLLIVKGLELIYGQFYSALESQGLRPIKALGERLDPYRHEVLMQEEAADEKKDCIVAEEFQKGYMLNDVVLRYSKVKVLKFKAKEGKVNGSISDDKNKTN